MTGINPSRLPAPPHHDRSAWIAQNILPHERALRLWLAHRKVTGLEVDDIVQDTYALLAALGSVEHIDAPKAYAFKTAHSLVLRHVRRSKIVRIDSVADMTDIRLVLDEPSPEREVAGRLYLAEVLDLIARLPRKCREAFTLRRFEGLSQRDIALRMGISESTVEKHMCRAVRLLMAAVAAGGLAEPSKPRAQREQRPGVSQVA